MRGFGIIGFSMIGLILMAQAGAEPMKCVVDGKTLYTDDTALCAQGSIKPIKGNVLISSFPKASEVPKSAPISAFKPPALFDGILQRFGLSQQELEEGWRTVMEAHQRGSWKAPEMPDEEK